MDSNTRSYASFVSQTRGLLWFLYPTMAAIFLLIYFAGRAHLQTVSSVSVPRSVVSAVPNEASATTGLNGSTEVPYAAICNLTVIPGDVETLLTWSPVAGASANGGGYIVSRSTTSGGPYTQVNGALINGGCDYLDTDNDNGLTVGTTYYYVVTYLDQYGNLSPPSAEASATTVAAGGQWSVSISPSGSSSGKASAANISALGNTKLTTGTANASVAGPQTSAVTESGSAVIGGDYVAAWSPNNPGTLPGLYVIVEDHAQSVDDQVTGVFTGDASVGIAGSLSLDTIDPASATAILPSPSVTMTVDQSTAGVVNITYTSTDHTRTIVSPTSGSTPSYTEDETSTAHILHVYTPAYFAANFSTARYVSLTFPLAGDTISSQANADAGMPAGDNCAAWGLVTDTYSSFTPDAN